MMCAIFATTFDENDDGPDAHGMPTTVHTVDGFSG